MNDCGSSKNADDEVHSFVFRISVDNVATVRGRHLQDNLLVDCGATAHIINDKTKFVSFDDSLDSTKHLIELADGSRTNGIAGGRGDESVLLYDVNGNSHYVKLENALYVPSYKQNIFSVQAATHNGASVNFSQ